MTSCAGTNTIAALLAGAASAEAAERLELHLDQCPTCRRFVADLGRGLSAVSDGARGSLPDRLPRPGETIGRYEIQRVIGVGGMGVVYEARDTTLGRSVAVKLLRPDLLEGTSLLAEAQAMARLQHPNIATVHDAGIAHGQLYVCMEYVAGPTLRAWIAERTRDWREIVAVYAAAGEGLAYVHRAGLVHLDFKPDNVLVDAAGRVRVTDFGLARIVGARPSDGGRMIVGTPAYMPPEQRRGGPMDARADQFAFCASLREALHDANPPHWLRRLIDRGLVAHPDDRFASMDELLVAIAAGLSRRRRHVARLTVVGLVATVAAIMSALPGPARVVTRVVDRPVAHAGLPRIVIAERDRASGADVGVLASAARAAPMGTAASMTYSAARTFSAPRRAPMLHPEPMSFWSVLGRSIDASDATREPGLPGESGSCDDGSLRSCARVAPECPSGTMLAVQQGCWTCADETCAPLGLPRPCGDGSCWFPSHPPSPPPPVGSNGGSNGGSGGGGSGGGSNDAGPTCSNGFCEVGETFSSCAQDCCETDASGACRATCGNGFCEAGETHASCGTDCCETNVDGSCVAVCGNGFCEAGETVASCPTECD